MRTWIQVLAGLLVGTLIALLIPREIIISGNAILTSDIVYSIASKVLSIGRYIILPLFFFSMIISISQMQRKNVFFKNIIKVTGVMAAFTLLLVIIGVISSLMISPGQIPVVIDTTYKVNVPSLGELITASFPDNVFSVFLSNFDQKSNMFIPLFVLALVLGTFITKTSREESEPTYNLIDSLSRISFKINEYFLRILVLWITILSASYIIIVRDIKNIETFIPLSIMLLILTVIIIFIIYPIIFYYTSGKRTSFKYIIAQMPSLIIAAITGDQFFTGTIITSSHKRVYRVKREISGFNLPFLTLFSKSGTALVSIISFIVILKSYSSLEITPSQILWVGAMSFLISFCLPTKAVGSSIASIALLCSLYGYGGMEESFIILTPAFPIITAVSTVINTATITLVDLIIDPEKSDLSSENI